MTMAINNEQIMREKSLVNLVMRLWTKISFFLILKHKLSKFMKLVEIVCVQVLGFVEDERCFFVMAFMKNKLRNWLTCHMDLCIRFFAQQFYTIGNFPFEDSITKCKGTKA
jgi:hypothetical protein